METKTRVLIADPSEDFRHLLADALAAEGDMEPVGLAEDGVEALALVAELKPDILLTELVLPRLDGLTLLRRLPDGRKPEGRRCLRLLQRPRCGRLRRARRELLHPQALRHRFNTRKPAHGGGSAARPGRAEAGARARFRAQP